MPVANVPTEADWGDWKDDLDSAYAHNRLVGKTLAEAEFIFASAPLGACEDLDWMPTIPFQFYIHAMKNFLLSDASRDEADGASCYLQLIERKIKNQPALILPVLPELLESVKIVANRQPFYRASPDIYGDFRELKDSILAEYGRYVARQP